MKPAQGWINFLTGVFLVLVGLGMLTPYFSKIPYYWGLAFIGSGGGLLGVGGLLANLVQSIRTNTEVTAAAAEALTPGKTATEIVADATAAAKGQPVPPPPVNGGAAGRDAERVDA